MGFEVLDMSNQSSAWLEGGFPRGFRLKNPASVFEVICKAMAERSIAADNADSLVDTEGSRIDVNAVEYNPIKTNRLERKHFWDLGYHGVKTNIWYFMKEQILKIASCYCDPDKAYDFENYPDLENWTPESLEEKLREDYIKFSAFCDREKYLLFIYKVLNLCSVRRVGTADSAASGNYRWINTQNGYFTYDDKDEMIELLKSRDFSLGACRGFTFMTHCDHLNRYELYQYSPRFVTWVDDDRPCDITFYGCASDSGIDEFSPMGVENVKLNKWFCAGQPTINETVGNIKAAVLEFEYPDTLIPDIPELGRSSQWVKGFELKRFKSPVGNLCYGIAVRDQRNYLKYFEKDKQ